MSCIFYFGTNAGFFNGFLSLIDFSLLIISKPLMDLFVSVISKKELAG